jgi:hypothetical protein
MIRFLRWLWHRDPEALESARRADRHADIQLARARENGRWAERLLMENHLTRRFFVEMQRRGTI